MRTPVLNRNDQEWLTAMIRVALDTSEDSPDWSSFQYLLLGNWNSDKWGLLTSISLLPCPEGKTADYWGLAMSDSQSGDSGYYYVSNREVFLGHVARRYGKQAVLSALMELEAT